jgi:hypothetical protein
MDRLHDLLKFHDEQIPFLGFHIFGLEFKPHKVHIFEFGIKFYIKSGSKH